MPSFATLFLIATSAFATLVTAAPTNVLPGSNVVKRDGFGDFLGGIDVGSLTGGVGNVGSAAGDLPKRQEAIDDIFDKIDLNSGPIGNRRDAGELRSLPIILLSLQAQVVAISERCNSIIAVGAKVEVAVILPILGDLRGALYGALVEIRLLAGQPVEFVLLVGGTVWAILDVAKLLGAILSVVFGILCIVLQAVKSVDLDVINPLLAIIGGIVCDLLVAIFLIVDGLPAVLIPLLGNVLPLVRVLNFTSILAVLQVKA